MRDFDGWLHCLDCAYDDLGYSGLQSCMPRTKGCKPIFPYDWKIASRIRHENLTLRETQTFKKGENV